MNGHKAKELRRAIYGDYSRKDDSKAGQYRKKLYKMAKKNPTEAIKWGREHAIHQREEASESTASGY